MTRKPNPYGFLVYLAAVVILGCMLVAMCQGYELPDPPPAEPAKAAKQSHTVVVEQYPMLRHVQVLDALLARIEQLRSRVDVPRLVLPGPTDDQEKLSVTEYERKLDAVLLGWLQERVVALGNCFRLERFDQPDPDRRKQYGTPQVQKTEADE